MPVWREAHFKVKIHKTFSTGALLEVELLKMCTPLWCEAYFEVRMLKAPRIRTTIGDVEAWLGGAGAIGILHLAKSKRNVRVL